MGTIPRVFAGTPCDLVVTLVFTAKALGGDDMICLLLMGEKDDGTRIMWEKEEQKKEKEKKIER